MVRFWRGGLAALVLGLAVGAAGAQTSGWLPGWLGGGKPAPRPEDKAPSLADEARKVPDRTAELETLEHACGRRLAVCLELRKIAAETDDEALGEEANRLEGLAFQLYKERSGKLLGARSIGLGDGPKVDRGLDETRDLLLEKARRGRTPSDAARRTPLEGDR